MCPDAVLVRIQIAIDMLADVPRSKLCDYHHDLLADTEIHLRKIASDLARDQRELQMFDYARLSGERPN